jgi:hypothetical protein
VEPTAPPVSPTRGPYFTASLIASAAGIVAVPVGFALQSPLLYFAPVALGAVFGNGLFATWLTLRRRRGDRLALSLAIGHALGLGLAVASLFALMHTNIRLFD